MSGGFITSFIIFHILNLVVLTMILSALVAHPFAQSKYKKMISLCDIPTNWKWKKVNYIDRDGEEIEDFHTDEPKSVSGSVVTVYILWILVGVCLYVITHLISTVPTTMIESQDTLSIQQWRYNHFNMAAITRFWLDNPSKCNANILSSFRVTGKAVKATSGIRSKYEASSEDDKYCYVWVEAIIDGHKLSSQVYIDVSLESSPSFHVDAKFGLLSAPFDMAAFDARRSVLNYLKSRAMYCARFSTMGFSNASIYSDPKSFVFHSSPSRETSSTSFLNLLHFSTLESTIPAIHPPHFEGRLLIEVNINNQRAYLVQSQPILNIVMVIVVAIGTAILSISRIRLATFILISKYRRSFTCRVIILITLVFMASVFYLIMGLQISWHALLRGSVIPSIMISGVIHFTLYSIAILLNMIIYHKRYREHEKALNSSLSPVLGGETGQLLSETSLPINTRRPSHVKVPSYNNNRI